ncbi:thiamin pyrophosphokinase 1 isoform X1 [Manduca sexta]|uniref:thiamin pyrophosphokinase 1 isoform X1 n=1 Tax=Manduca sexta TaxID=7130 RepID=UPI00189070AD|nr:thiamin pyrophosphokinase 1 isoform X1 [Manduca sexta]
MTTNGVINNAVKTLNNIFCIQQHGCGTSCKIVKCWKWDIAQITSPQTRRYIKYAVLILNRPILQSNEFIKDFWNNATVRITIDGGTKQWDRYLSNMPEGSQKAMKIPDLVTGDFDSITEDVMQKYKKKGCKIVHTPDQNHTDFTKALMELHKYCQENKIQMDNVIAIGQSSGRLDQILGNIQTLFLAKEKQLLNPNTKLFLMSDDAISWLLQPGDHVVSIPDDTRKHKRAWCSLVPIGETCQSVTSSGLKWNLNDQPLKYGEIVSTSNTFDGSEKVMIKCSNTLLWSMRVPCLLGQ